MLVYLIIGIVILFIIIESKKEEGIDNTLPSGDVPTSTPAPAAVQPMVETIKPFGAHEDTYATVSSQAVAVASAPLNSNDLLPVYNKDAEFTKENPVASLLQKQNFLQAGYHFGINTVVQSNKIPYLDIRSAPPIPKMDVGPFNNSSYEQPAGHGRRFLEVGV